ncbi:hypothetical protein [Clostridium hydrogenum]|uniref:hypothetical protein n=1 Tax=Clostridium hydrogenum TaxID=2855764 RepID=UPI001F445B28|nr:hypothetical protein [Clostridium hydrogenum]
MNKKKIFGTLTAAFVITISTSVIAFASQNATQSTKDVVKVETQTVKNQSQNQSTIAAATNTSASKGFNMTSDKAIAIAKQTIKNIYGVDLDKEGITQVTFYWPKDFNNGVDNTDELIKKGFNTPVTLEFCKPNDSSLPDYIDASAKVAISLRDGKVRDAEVYNNIDRRLKGKYDDNRVKSVIAQFLKDKGFDTNYTGIRTGGPDTCAVVPYSAAYVDYPDGVTKWVQVNILNYTVNGYGESLNKKFLN